MYQRKKYEDARGSRANLRYISQVRYFDTSKVSIRYSRLANTQTLVSSFDAILNTDNTSKREHVNSYALFWEK